MYRNYYTNTPTEYQYVCDNCEREFDEPYDVHTTYESYYGVSSLFPNSTPMTLAVCPYCGSDDIRENELLIYFVTPGEPLANRRFYRHKPNPL